MKGIDGLASMKKEMGGIDVVVKSDISCDGEGWKFCDLRTTLLMTTCSFTSVVCVCAMSVCMGPASLKKNNCEFK